MNKKVRKLLLSFVTTGMLATVIAPVFVASAKIQSDKEYQKDQSTMVENYENTNFYTDKEEKLVNVTLYSDENKTITVDIPETHVEEYTKKLENEDFRQQEITNSLESNSKFRAASSTIRYMREKEVAQVLDSMDSTRNWERIISNPATDYVVGLAAGLLSQNNFATIGAGVLSWSITDLMGRQRDWWNESVLMIIKDDNGINYVKLTITPSGKDYPKVYRTLERG